MIIQKKKQYHDQKLREIEESIDQSQFWERWNNFNNKKDNLALQNGNIWKDHFEKLYEQISPNNLIHEQKQIQEKLTILETSKIMKKCWASLWNAISWVKGKLAFYQIIALLTTFTLYTLIIQHVHQKKTRATFLHVLCLCFKKLWILFGIIRFSKSV